MTLSDPEGVSPITSLFKWDWSYLCMHQLTIIRLTWRVAWSFYNSIGFYTAQPVGGTTVAPTGFTSRLHDAIDRATIARLVLSHFATLRSSQRALLLVFDMPLTSLT